MVRFIGQHRRRSTARSVRSWYWLTWFVVGLAALYGCVGSKQSPHPSVEPARSASVSASSSASASPARPGQALRRTPAPLAGYYGQQLDWKTCEDPDLDGLQCASIKVPLDYRHPQGRSIRLALAKVPATDPSNRSRSLVVNPGGPGLSGINYAAAAEEQFGTTLLQHYSIIGFDPRGVSRSTPLRCISDAQMTALADSDPSPDTAAEVRHNTTLLRALGNGCLKHDADLTRHVSTVEGAHDLDVIREVLGEVRLNYLGKSYGTLLGATYAHLFPTRVGRMVLDGAFDPRASTVAVNLAQARGFEGELRAYLNSCTRQPSCPADTVSGGLRGIHALLRNVDKSPLPTAGGGHLTVGIAVTGILAPLYDQTRWGELTTSLQAASAGDGRALRLLADESLHRNPDGTFRDNAAQVQSAIWCADHDDALPPEHVNRHLASFEKAAPTFGAAFAFNASTCAQWPVHTKRHPSALLTTGSRRVIVVGTTHDPATPYAMAQTLAHQLRGSVMITRSGHGHTGYHQGNACVDAAIETFLVDGVITHHVHC